MRRSGGPGRSGAGAAITSAIPRRGKGTPIGSSGGPRGCGDGPEAWTAPSRGGSRGGCTGRRSPGSACGTRGAATGRCPSARQPVRGTQPNRGDAWTGGVAHRRPRRVARPRELSIPLGGARRRRAREDRRGEGGRMGLAGRRGLEKVLRGRPVNRFHRKRPSEPGGRRRRAEGPREGRSQGDQPLSGSADLAGSCILPVSVWVHVT